MNFFPVNIKIPLSLATPNYNFIVFGCYISHYCTKECIKCLQEEVSFLSGLRKGCVRAVLRIAFLSQRVEKVKKKSYGFWPESSEHFQVFLITRFVSNQLSSCRPFMYTVVHKNIRAVNKGPLLSGYFFPGIPVKVGLKAITEKR
jgi:hypothetical protein